jgi:hypothetical protein
MANVGVELCAAQIFLCLWKQNPNKTPKTKHKTRREICRCCVILNTFEMINILIRAAAGPS